MSGARRVLAILLFASLGCARHVPAPAPKPPPVEKSPTATVMLSADLRGYLAPCGCSENMRGGIARAAHLVSEARKEGPPVLYLDAGDTLFGLPPIAPEEVGQEELKARALAQALEAMGVAAHGVGPLDVKRGEAFERSLGLPDLIPGVPRLLELGGHRVAMVSGASADALKSGAGLAREKGTAWILGAFLGSPQQAQAAAARSDLGVDLIVSAHAAEELDHDESQLVHGAIPLVMLQSKGRSLLRLDLSFGEGPFHLLETQADLKRKAEQLTERIALLDRQANLPGLPKETVQRMEAKIGELATQREAVLATRPQAPKGENAFSVKFVPLEATLPMEPKVEAIVRDYDAKVGEVNLAWARAHPTPCPTAAKGEPSYVGNEACAECHEEAAAFWRTTKHSHAFASLVEAKKSYRVDCVRCHVTGWGKPGGVCSVAHTEPRRNVGCEACHGPGSLHADDPSADNIRLKPTREICVTCHNKENSPHFDFGLYLPQILGEGHGRTPNHRNSKGLTTHGGGA